MPELLATRPRAKIETAPLPRVVYRWDLDKTYLKSEFDSIRELVKLPFEKAEDKIAAPGVTALIRALRETAGRQGRETAVYFISASPPQIGRAIRQKLELDGVVYEGIVFKDQLQRLMRGKFRHLREQVGYKLTELLKARRAEAPGAREYLFGDDWESDPLIYSLYADVAAGRVARDELAAILGALRVDPALVEFALDLAGQMERREVVARIFINLERRTPPSSFQVYGARLVPAFNYLQTAACLYEEGTLDREGFALVARSLVDESGYSAERISNSLADVERRGHVRRDMALALRRVLVADGLLSEAPPSRRERWRALWRRMLERLPRRRTVPDTAPLAVIDYRAMVAGEPPAESRTE